MISNVEVEMEEIDWECLHLLSKKEKIPVPSLIGRMIASKLEEYEDFQYSINPKLAIRNSEDEGGILLEDLCKKLGIDLNEEKS